MNCRHALLLFMLSAASLTATTDYSLTARELKAPVFDVSGHLIRRLTAETANGSMTAARLEKGRVEFFAPASAEQVLALLDFEHARYTKDGETIDGDDVISFTSKDGVVRGRGFTCKLETGELTLNSAVTYNSDRFKLSGDHADLR